MQNLTRPLYGAIKRNINLTSIRGATPKSGAKKPSSRPEFDKMRKLQEHYQKHDGLPIFLKAGTRDQILYRGTLALTILGVILDMKYYLTMAFA